MLKKLEVEARLISSDQLGNIYLVVKNNIKKYDQDGNFINQYSNNRYGEISSIDATDPYKIIVFYLDFRVIVILDNQLSENGSPLDLQFTEFDQPVIACRAYNTGVWLFDQLLHNIYRLTLSLKTLHSSGNLSQILGHRINPDYMIEYNNSLYLNNPETGILVFDQYGTYVKKIPLKNLRSFVVSENSIFFLENGQIKKYLFKDLTIESLPLPEKDIEGFAMVKNRLYLIKKGEIRIYDYKGEK